MNISKFLIGLMLIAGLAACGGGGGSPGSSPNSGNTPTTPVVPAAETPASIEVQASANEVLSANGAEVLITAVVKNANNASMPNQVVTFAVDNRATLTRQSSETDDDGVATARLSAGQDKALRNVTVTVTSGGAIGQITLPVTGTRLSIAGASDLKRGDTQSFTARLVDSAGQPIARQQISLSSALGNSLGTAPPTDLNGTAQFLYTANNAGADTLTVSALGASAQATVRVTDVDFSVVTPGDNTAVIVGASQTITVRYATGSGSPDGKQVLFNTTLGTLSAASVTTSGGGFASVQITSPSAGPASVVAEIVGVGRLVLPLQFVATVPATLELQANPGAVAVNLNGATNNQSTIAATVKDASNNPVANRQVAFTLVDGAGNGGTLSSPTATTDVNGRAEVQFIPGSSSTGGDAVLLRAVVSGTSISDDVRLTVNGQALFIKFFFGNTISNVDETTYRKAVAVAVTDVDGQAVPTAKVTLSAVPSFYGRGTLAWNGTLWTYAPGVRLTCPNEDINLNGSLESGEDTDGDKQLTPGNPVLVLPGTVTTGSDGRALFDLQYGENIAPWLILNLQARAEVGGTESRSSIAYLTSGLASDFSSETVSPAGAISPFGSSAPLCP